MRIDGIARRFAGCMVLVVVVSAMSAAGASAVIVRLANGHTVSYQPLRSAPRADSAFSNVDYNGGPVMPSNTDTLVFWSPSGLSAYGSGATPEYVSGIERYFTDLSHDNGGHANVDSVSTQYNDATGAVARYAVTYGGAIVDTDPYPASQCPAVAPVTECMTDAQLQAELERVASAHGLRRDLSHEVFLLTPPNVASCFTSDPTGNPPYGGCSANEQVSPAFCAYHGQTTVSPLMFYSFDPYIVGNSGCDDGNHPNGPSDGALVGGLSHEHNESITDPIPNDAWTNGYGANQGLEIGDQCDSQMGAALGTAPNGAVYNQVINGHPYWYQEEWSNQGHTCLQRYTPSGTQPTATFTATAGSGLAMTFDATGSTASGGVADFNWQFNDSFGAQTVEQTTPSITHTFPASGAYSVGLTVYGADGYARGIGHIITTGHSGFTPAFSVSTAVAGHAVSFRALTNVSGQPVSVDFWNFGDGTTGSGATPTHTYATAGTYKVTAVLFSGIGSAFPGAGAAPIYARSVVVKVPTQTSVSAPSSGTHGVTIGSSAIAAALSGASSTAGGAVTFKVFGPQTSAPTVCTSGGSTVGTATVAGAGTYHPSAGFTPAGAGSYWWYATYGGDAANATSHSACGSTMVKTAVS